MTNMAGKPVAGGGLIRCQVVALSREAKKRLAWFDFWRAHGGNARQTCRYFGISAQTFYRWKKRFDPRELCSLEAHSCRPRHVRRPTWDAKLEEDVIRLRREYPRWGKQKLRKLLEREGKTVSASMIGRVLARMKKSGRLVEPLPGRPRKRSKYHPRPWAIRKPANYVVRKPGDLVEVDTKDIRPLPGKVLKHFSGCDCVSRWGVIEVHERATALTAGLFLDALTTRCPFRIRAIQVDGGSEFKAGFEEACRRRRIRLFALPPKSPKLNACVERIHRTHQEEFYEVYELPWTATEIAEHVLRWEVVYNTVRPHQSLGYLTPQEYLDGRRGAGGAAPRAGHDRRAPQSPPRSAPRQRATAQHTRHPLRELGRSTQP